MFYKASEITSEYKNPEAWLKAYREKRVWESLTEARNIAKMNIAEAAAITGTRVTLIMALEDGNVVPAYDMYEAYIAKIAQKAQEGRDDGQGQV